MDANISCPDSSSCLLSFLRRRYYSKNKRKKNNNIYNIESAKIITHTTKLESESSSATTSAVTQTYVKYDKYIPSVNEEHIRLNLCGVTSGEHSAPTKPVRQSKLERNLSRNHNQCEDPPQFINELEENSKKIESSFPKCLALPAEKDYEKIRQAVKPMFKDTDELKPLPQRKKRADGITCSPSFELNESEYEHIKLALKMMFTNVDCQMNEEVSRKTPALPPPPDCSSPRKGSKTDTRLQHLVEDVLKLKSSHIKEAHHTKKPNPQNVAVDTSSEESTDDHEDTAAEIISSPSTSSLSSNASRIKLSEANDSDLNAEIKRLEREYNREKGRKKNIKRLMRKKENYQHQESSTDDDNKNANDSCQQVAQVMQNITHQFNECKNDDIKTEPSLSYGSTRASLDSLDAILLQMRDVGEKRKELEKEQTEAFATLREKQNELQWRSNCSAAEKVKLCDTIEALQSKIRELEKKMELQNVHHEELALEMTAIKRCSAKRSSLTGSYSLSSWKKPNASNQEVQTSPESNTSELLYLDRLVPSRTYRSTSNSHHTTGSAYETRGFYRSRQHRPTTYHGCLTSIPPNSSFVDLHLASLDPSTRCSNCAIACKPSSTAYWAQSSSELPCTCPVSSDQEIPSSALSSNASACSDDSGIQNLSHSHTSNIMVDVDKIMAKIDHDNRVLAELDKTRSTIATRGCMTAEQFRNISEMGVLPPATCQQMLPTVQQSGLPASASQTTLQHQSMLTNAFSTYLQQLDLNNSMNRQPLGSAYPNQIQQMSQVPTFQSSYSILQPGYQGNYSNILPFDLEGVRSIKNGTLPSSNFASTSDLLLAHEDFVLEGHSLRSQDMIEIPGKGLCNIFIAKHSFDPFLQSTNICPEAELAFNTGDYLLVYGEPDDDGYVDAELMDGRRGLVPIIFIQKLSGDELLEFKQRVLAGLKEIDDSASTTIPHNIESLHTDEHGKKFKPEYSTGMTTEDEDDETDESQSVPAPKQLTLERQLNKSILIRWNPPDESPSHSIDSYHVYVDGVLKTTVKANERTKALLEGVDSTKPHRISVRSVTPNRRTSRDAACTMLIGKDVPRYPTNLKAYHVTPTSAVISWMPSNSNYQHTVCVNNIEIRTVKPGVYRHMITGLVPNTIYRVTVRAKNIRAPQFDDKSASDKFASHLDFRTLSKGMPDPPSEIQVELGPQDGTLLVTWVPVTAENSNGAPVTGYAVYADGNKVTDIDSPTGDHALIDISKIISMNPRHVTVRTKSKENHSSDSNATSIPASALKGKHTSKSANHNRHPARNAYGQVIIDPDENLSDKEVYPGQAVSASAMGMMKENQHDENYSEEEFLETHRSNRNLRYNQSSPRSHGPSRSHPDRRGPPGSNPAYERNMARQNYNSRMYDPRRENREYHHSPQNRSIDRRRVNEMHLEKGGGRGVSHPATMNANRAAAAHEKPRMVVAICDYNPSRMSPNLSTSHEELTVAAGDRIKILSDLDPDGYYWAECHGKQGFVAQNVIQELDSTSKMNKRNNRGDPGGRTRLPPQHLDLSHGSGTKKMVALYDFNPRDHSPIADSDGEISFAAGQIIYVKGEPDDDGFYLGEVEGVQGLVPSNFLQEVEEIPDEMDQPFVSQGNRSGGIRPLPPRDRNRGHGPGARGPPPPPRDGMPPRGDIRDRRKDTRLQYENPQDQLRTQGRIGDINNTRLLHLAERRTGRESHPSRNDLYDNMTRDNDTSAGMGTSMQNNHLGGGCGGGGMSGDANRTSSFRTSRTRGVPNALPTNAAGTKAGITQPASGTGVGGLKFPESPNIMQKLSEMTSSGGAENPVDNILSKGKELIFMKFGLGK